MVKSAIVSKYILHNTIEFPSTPCLSSRLGIIKQFEQFQRIFAFQDCRIGKLIGVVSNDTASMYGRDGKGRYTPLKPTLLLLTIALVLEHQDSRTKEPLKHTHCLGNDQTSMIWICA